MASNQTLDPKLKEAYDRVMQAAIPTPVSKTPPAPAAPAPLPPVKAAEIKEKIESKKTSLSFVPGEKTQNAPSVPSAPSKQNAPSVQKKFGGISPALIVLLLLVFFAVYAFFWISFFKISLPFLPSS